MSAMKISLVPPTIIRRSPLNLSPSKYACPFAREQRFKPLNPECKKHAYVKDESKLSKMRFSVGKGSRSDFTKTLTCSPPSTKYVHKTAFQRDPRKGKSFGSSREGSPDRSYHKLSMWKTPSPQQYEPKKPERSSSSYSMRKKTVDFDGDRLSFKKAPGPGAYTDQTLAPTDGRFRLSKYRDSKLAKIHPTSARFQENNSTPTPGPFQYIRSDQFSSVGSYTLSKHKGEGRRPFNREARVNFTDIVKHMSQTLPGPGQYERQSIFGVYGDSKYYKSLNVTIS